MTTCDHYFHKRLITMLKSRIFMAFNRMMRNLMVERQPDFVIGGQERPYLRRWWIIPRNPIFNVYLHQFLRSDDDRALHDHPWLFNCSILVDGFYAEHTPDGVATRFAGDWKFRWGRAPHRIELLTAAPAGEEKEMTFPCVTLFITGPRVRQWGFYCPQGWVHWRDFTAADDPGSVGPGCGS